MDAVKFLKEMNRMCSKIQCETCSLRYTNNGMDLPCYSFTKYYPEKAIETVEKWSAEHPVKTRQSEFLKMFPNASIEHGCLDICPEDVDKNVPCYNKLCVDCKKEYWLAEVE